MDENRMLNLLLKHVFGDLALKERQPHRIEAHWIEGGGGTPQRFRAGWES